VTLGWLVTAYLLSSAVALVPMGRASDIFGRKRFFIAGMGLYSSAALLSSFAGSILHLFLCQILMGLGGSLIFATSMAILISVYPPEQRGRVLGIAVASVYFGLSVGPFVGGILTFYFGWRSVFFVNVPLGVIVMFLAATRLETESNEAEREPYDIPGALIYAVAVVSLLYGISSLPHPRSFWLIPLNRVSGF